METLPSNKRRYQNTSRILTSVLKNEKSHQLRPGSVIELTQRDVEMTKDSTRERGKDPVSTGLVQRIPDGMDSHPDWEPIGRTVKPREAERLVGEAPIEEVQEVVSKIGDSAGIAVMQTVLGAMQRKVPEARLSEIEGMVDERATNLSEQWKRDKKKYAEALR